jgi:hypothetical protein
MDRQVKPQRFTGPAADPLVFISAKKSWPTSIAASIPSPVVYPTLS